MANMHDDPNNGDPNEILGGDPETDPSKSGGSSGNEPGSGDGDQFPANWEEVFKHPRFKELTAANRKLKEEVDAFQKAKADAAEAREKAEAEALKDQEKFKELAEKTGAKYDKLKEEAKALRAQVEAFETLATADIEARLETFPEALRNLLDPLLEGKSPIDQLGILQAQADTIQALIGDSGDGSDKKKPPRGVPPTPPKGNETDEAKAKKEAFRKRYRQQIRQGL